MFQFKNSGSGEEPSLANKFPNFHGKVRTFKEDTENFEKGQLNAASLEEENIFSSPVPTPAEKSFSPQQPLTGENPNRPQPTYLKEEAPPENPFQSMPTPPPVSSPEPDLSALKSSPSQSFFSEKPPTSENILPPQTETNPSPQKPKKAIFVSLIILFAAIITAAGFYYYWFYIKGAAPATPVTPETALPETQPTPDIPSDNSQNNLRKIIVDTSKSPTEIQSATKTFATDFIITASEGSLIEVKILDQTNQPIGKKDFFTGFGITVPNAVAMKLSEDYSLFVKKEEGSAKLGLVFKTVTSSGLTDEMKIWEQTIANDLKSIFTGQTPAGATAFNSSRYKNADIRYSNFSSPAGTSLDYSVISNFLIIGTSKDTTRAILDYMSEK
jgi:hypothetical protein